MVSEGIMCQFRLSHIRYDHLHSTMECMKLWSSHLYS